MIRVFRRVRKQLLSENKSSIYFLYAIGEIALVVIGIIIALQLDSLHESNVASKNELQLYSNILDDLKSEYYINKYYMADFKRYQDLHFHVYNESKGLAQYDPDQFYNYLLWFQRYSMFIIDKYSEALTIITNENIHSQLKLYMKQESRTKGAVDEWNEHQLQHVRPFFSKYGINNSEIAHSEQTYDFTSLIRLDLIEHSKLKEQYGTRELDQLLFTIRFKTSWMHQNFIWLNEFNREFTQILKNELELHKITYWDNQDKYDDLVIEADLYYESKEYQKSALKYKEAFELLEAHPDQVEAYQEDRYDAACTYALVEDVDSAFSQLFILANGPSKYNDYERITNDSDLDILHKDKRWNELIALVESNNEETELE